MNYFFSTTLKVTPYAALFKKKNLKQLKVSVLRLQNLISGVGKNEREMGCKKVE